MRRSVLAALVVVSTVPGTQARTSPAPGQAEAVRAIFTPVTGAPERPSAAVAWITEGADAEFAFFGRADLGAPDAPDAQTFYEIGSITKGLTGIILADMARAGEIGIHDRLEALLPDGESMPEAIRRITLAQLATHSSGLPRMPGNIIVGMTDPMNPFAHYDEARLLAFLRNYKAPVANTITPEYSNLGFGLLGYVLARKAGMPYEELLKTRVLEPLGMHDTTITMTSEQSARLAPPFSKGQPARNWDLNVFAGAGAVRSTAADMSKLLRALMYPPDGRLGTAIALALEPRGSLGSAQVGFGWVTSTRPNGQTVVWHDGGTGGYRAFMGFTPPHSPRAGVVVLTNTGDDSANPLGFRALEALAR